MNHIYPELLLCTCIKTVTFYEIYSTVLKHVRSNAAKCNFFDCRACILINGNYGQSQLDKNVHCTDNDVERLNAR